MNDLRQNPSYIKWMKTIGWETKVVNHPGSKTKNTVFIKTIPLIGSVIKLQRPRGEIPFEELAKIAESKRALFVKIEPDSPENTVEIIRQMTRYGYRFDRWALLATKTRKVDLTLTRDLIFGQFKKDCRYDIRKAQQAHLTCEWDNFEKFYRLLKIWHERKKIFTFSKDQYDKLIQSFGKNVFCLIISSDTAIAGCCVLVAGKTAYYWLAGSSPQGKTVQAPYLAVWEAMKEAKKRNCTLWDFEGIHDERTPSTKKWVGFSHFKESFGGYEVTFPGSFTWYRNLMLRLISPLMN